MTTDLAALLDVGPLGRRVVDVVTRWAFNGHDGPTMAAARILADPDIAAGLAATPVLERLRLRHQPKPWGRGSQVVVCSCGSGSFDACPDAAILAGRRWPPVSADETWRVVDWIQPPPMPDTDDDPEEHT